MIKCDRIKNLPVSFFSVILWLGWFVIVLQKLQERLNIPELVVNIFIWFVLSTFLWLLFLYIYKIFSHKKEYVKELNHPIKWAFFSTISISFLLFSIIFLENNLDISFVIWIIWTVMQFILLIKTLSGWINKQNFEIKHINPARFIPIVWNILVPISGIVHAWEEISWFFFSIWIIFWIILFTIFMYRIIFHHPLEEKLRPTLFILIAPAAIANISYIKINWVLDNFGQIMYYFALFMLIFLLSQYRIFIKTRFYLSWWAYSFPISAITIASILMNKTTGNVLFEIISLILFGLLVILISILIFNTVKAIWKKEICIEE